MPHAACNEKWRKGEIDSSTQIFLCGVDVSSNRPNDKGELVHNMCHGRGETQKPGVVYLPEAQIPLSQMINGGIIPDTDIHRQPAPTQQAKPFAQSPRRPTQLFNIALTIQQPSHAAYTKRKKSHQTRPPSCVNIAIYRGTPLGNAPLPPSPPPPIQPPTTPCHASEGKATNP